MPHAKHRVNKRHSKTSSKIAQTVFRAAKRTDELLVTPDLDRDAFLKIRFKKKQQDSFSFLSIIKGIKPDKLAEIRASLPRATDTETRRRAGSQDDEMKSHRIASQK